MFCSHCGRPLESGALYCAGCGEPAFPKPSEDDLSALVMQARCGNQMAVSRLYEKTYSKVYHTVRSMIKDEDTVLDIVQDTYLKAFANLNRFEGNDRFLPWIRQIAANTARDFLKKKRPTLFSDLYPNAEDQDAAIEEQFVDERTSSIPERMIDEAETKRLLREIIDSLPEDQRAAIGMFYYEEMSVKEIAEAMGASESAVKSRLMYARKKIEKNVRDLEKKGTKLYNLAPIPFLLLLFRCQKTYAAELPDQAIQNAVLQSTAPAAMQAAAASQAASAAGAAGASTVKAGSAAIGLITKIVIAAAVTVIGGGIFAAAKLDLIHIGPKAPAAITQEADSSLTEKQDSFTEDDSDKEDPFSEADSSLDETIPTTEEPEAAEEDSDLSRALALYREIIAQASSYDYDSGNTTLYHQYALEYLQSTDPVPSLLLEQVTQEGWMYAHLFQYDTVTGTLIQPEKVLIEGVGQIGGFRGSLAMMEDGNGIRLIEWSSGSGSGDIYRAVLTGDSLETTHEWSGHITDDIPDAFSVYPITWMDVTDLSLIDTYSSVPSQSTASFENAETEETEESKEAAVPAVIEEEGRITVSGVIDLYSYEDVIDLQGCEDPNARWGGPEYGGHASYLMLVLDEPTEMTTVTVHGETHTGTVRLILLQVFIGEVSATDFSPYYGRHLTFTVDPNRLGWPSDTRMPVSQPSGGDIHVFE